ncbi:MAG: hypothetical protein ACE5KM_13780 [Planctomycetaceae bacterium]
MADLLKIGSDWLAGQLKDAAGQSVTYHRGGDQVSVTATVGQQRRDINSDFDQRLEAKRKDFVIDAADLIFSSVVITPARGDRIKQVDGSTTYVYEVRSDGDDPAWRWSDRYFKRRRIHTLFIGTE